MFIQLNWQPVVGHEQLDLKDIVIAPLAGRVASAGLVREQVASLDAHIVAAGDWERVDDVAGKRVELLQVLTQGKEQVLECVVQVVDLTRKNLFAMNLIVSPAAYSAVRRLDYPRECGQ
jgi:hypothetical protein